MSPAEIALLLREILKKDKIIFIKTYPEILDFTSDSPSSLIICNKTNEYRIFLDKKNLITTIGLLNAAIFQDKEITVIAWNIKSYFSYIKHHTKTISEILCILLDLKPIERYLNIEASVPNSYLDAFKRISAILKNNSWSSIKNIYNNIHLPLITEVLPSLETQGIFDLSKRKILYAQYEIEGQVNGRFKCFNAYENSFIPHTIGPSEKENFRTVKHDEIFMLFDYKNMEVSVLQWLSKDERLKQVLELDEDLYKVVFKLVTGIDCDDDKKREICKKFFLPVIYGQQPEGLSVELGVSVKSAAGIINKINSLFKRSVDWINSLNLDFDNCCSDVFGRKRKFEGERYRNQLRNFLVQSPDALICSHKLIQLYKKLHGHIAYNVHDGYNIYVHKSSVRSTMLMIKEILEKDDDLYPDIKLKVLCKTGTKISDLKIYP